MLMKQPIANGHLSSGISRRAAIRAGTLGLMGGLGMGDLARLHATPGPLGSVIPAGRAKSVIYIFLSGGLPSTKLST